MKGLIALRAFGLTPLDAVRYYTAMIMASHGTVSTPNIEDAIREHRALLQIHA
jgi:hypothetical protein